MTVRILTGDCRDVLAGLPTDSVHACVTSPPYWGLRCYNIPPTIWGGDAACEHIWGDTISVNATNHTDKARWNHTRNGRDELQPVEKRVSWLRTEVKQGQFCQSCGAWAGAHGLEPSIDLYVKNAVEIFRAVHRVLRPDGTLWLNLGDSYGAQKGTGFNTNAYTGGGNRVQRMQAEHGDIKVTTGLKPKDLCGIPWRVAFALQADGWYLRQDIIWAKPNPMPESVTDRCTKAHEYLFLLTKSARYFYDAEAIKEPTLSLDTDHPSYRPNSAKIAELGRKEFSAKHEMSARSYDPAGRNKRSVWTVATCPFPEAHFATFPPELIEPCIKAGCPKDGTVLDPFGGAGTTGLVADRLQRNAILIELNPDYGRMAESRIRADAPLLAQLPEAAE